MIKKQKLSESGVGHIILVLTLVVIGIIGLVGWRVLNANKLTANNQAASDNSNSTTDKQETNSQELIWKQGESGWSAMETPPECPDQPMMASPVDLTKVTSILYPGQTRGGNYKPHGGFRLDKTLNDKVTVTAPIDGFAVRGGRYLTEGEIQYTFDIMNNCGVMYRVGHFRELPEKLLKIADTWPAAQEGSSQTHMINPAVYIGKGEVLATSVGIVSTKNSFFDWGVYDFRQTNEASKSASFQQAHAQDKELSWHAVCWFDWLPASDAAKIRSLPAADPASGKKSDYCSSN